MESGLEEAKRLAKVYLDFMQMPPEAKELLGPVIMATFVAGFTSGNRYARGVGNPILESQVKGFKKELDAEGTH